MPLCLADDSALVPFTEDDAASCEPPPPQAAANVADATSTAIRGRARRHRGVARFLPPAVVPVMSLSSSSWDRVLAEVYDAAGYKPVTL